MGSDQHERIFIQPLVERAIGFRACLAAERGGRKKKSVANRK